MSFNRRQFITASLGSLTLLTSIYSKASAQNNSLIKPQKLKAGSGVGLVSPAGATFTTEDINIVQDAVKALGLVPYLAPHLLDQYGYLAGKDKDRANDINHFFADPKIDLILPIRGGWGCARVLPYLDYNLIQNNPKIIIGFSDLTALLIAIYTQSRLVTFHGPNGLTSWRTKQVNSFKQALFTEEKISFQNEKDADDTNRLMQVKNRIQTITPGIARGKLIGGNLSVLSSIIGSPYVPDFKDYILFIEDVGEEVYRIDRMITHLKVAGILDKISGFIFGECTNCLPNGGYASLTLEQVLNDHIKPLKIPAWMGAKIGHIEPVLTFPMGIEVEINANNGTINYLESGVI
ncbi:putative peptidase S66, LD-carboxypeptidase A [Crocosphaera subtropica ATCC 51142]|uniref:Peptidase S66, LD-carboxypeptidase A n=1 Tax=Crocosphaera subtropica (strain ATCC 51142 / BH68) TaxID=43989 RepID=B1X0R1_CROS5|nr:LD-carboxypeptidase [Crocosphaera subtropica]ACB52950.1 putative peptidase S66, LD-carboxypeptidase A [Crocosphaera subtropica ATCC 51142]